MDTPMWDMYNDESIFSDSSQTNDSSWDFGTTVQGGLNTANSWIDSLGGTFLKYAEIKNTYDGLKNSDASEQQKRTFERTTQEDSLTTSNPTSNPTLVYGAVGLVALYFIFKGGD